MLAVSQRNIKRSCQKSVLSLSILEGICQTLVFHVHCTGSKALLAERLLNTTESEDAGAWIHPSCTRTPPAHRLSARKGHKRPEPYVT